MKNPDVVAEISKNKNENQKIIGFCLTDKDFLNCAKLKLQNKNLDYIVINDEVRNAADRIMAIIRAEHAKTERSIHKYLELIENETDCNN